jgi:hypothetical protein
VRLQFVVECKAVSGVADLRTPGLDLEQSRARIQAAQPGKPWPRTTSA